MHGPAPQGEADPDLDERSCTPLRPAYASDLRDASLEAAGATDKLLQEPVTFIGGGPKNVRLGALPAVVGCRRAAWAVMDCTELPWCVLGAWP